MQLRPTGDIALLAALARARGLWYTFRKGKAEFMTTGNQSDSGTPVDGTSTKPPAPAHGGLRKVGIAAAIVAASALVFVSGCGKRNTQSSHGKVQLWEGGPYWAETNIGAEKPEDYGYYFWWGDTVGYKREGDAWVASDGSSRNFLFDETSSRTYGKGIDELRSEGWLAKDGALVSKHDAARVHWGGDWRMPTLQEQEDLKEKCDWEWTTKNGVYGYSVRGKGKYTSASIFLPCAGYDVTSLNYAGLGGYYWSSIPRSGYDYAWGLGFDSNGHGTGYCRRLSGQSVRPVQGFTK